MIEKVARGGRVVPFVKELLCGPGAKDLGTRTGMLAITGKRIGKPGRNWPVRNWVCRFGRPVIMKRMIAHMFCFGKEFLNFVGRLLFC